MIIPSIDIMQGRAVQLRKGRELVLDGGDPLERLEEFAVVGEVAVVDLDAALGQGSNAGVIREMVRRAPCRVGGGIRRVDTALDWLDAGATRVVIGTAATPQLCAQLPRERVIAAVDVEGESVVIEGWRRDSGRSVDDAVRALGPVVGGFLLTQVTREGGMAGFDRELVRRIVTLAGDARVTAAGGITTPEDVALLHAMGTDAQVGMALYAGRLTLGAAVAALLPADREPWPTVVCDEVGEALGLVWSTRESLERAVATRRGVYWSRSRREIWEKGATSGNTQTLVGVDVDCDGDTLRFRVHQTGAGFCHRGPRTCWGERFSLNGLGRTLGARAAAGDAQSGTVRLLRDPELLGAKLVEEAQELARAKDTAATVHEAADLIYFTFVRLRQSGVTLGDVHAELERRSRRVRRRPMTRKPAEAR
jgi:phosphoribosyl-ATP pyrophosphohydrolase/phosphoribosyl-AMP cyclohydrolase